MICYICEGSFLGDLGTRTHACRAPAESCPHNHLDDLEGTGLTGYIYSVHVPVKFGKIRTTTTRRQGFWA
eukprot:6206657-Pleurochrysis_carterae.AAC.4